MCETAATMRTSATGPVRIGIFLPLNATTTEGLVTMFNGLRAWAQRFFPGSTSPNHAPDEGHAQAERQKRAASLVEMQAGVRQVQQAIADVSARLDRETDERERSVEIARLHELEQELDRRQAEL